MNLIRQITLPHLETFILNQRSKHTRLAYRSDLAKFARFASDVNVEDVRLDHVVRFRDSLTGLSVSSINRTMVSVKVYLDFLVMQGILTSNPAAALKSYPQPDNATTEELSNEEVRMILNLVELGTSMGRMHNAILHLLFYLGLRRGEIVGMCADDFNVAKVTCTLKVRGKGGRERILPIEGELLQALELYTLNVPPFAVGAPFFPSPHDPNKPIHPNTIAQLFRNYSKRAGIERIVSPHSARATCISNALENGATLIQVQHLGGWQGADMVLRYDKRRQMLKNSASKYVKY